MSVSATFGEMSDLPVQDLIPAIDRIDCDESKLNAAQLQWRRDGINVLKNFLPDDLIDAYSRRRAALNNPGGWPSPTPYLDVPEMRDLALYPPLMKHMEQLIGEPMMLHLCLTGWVSTERAWHQDDYLNPPHVNSWYAAVWMALDDIHPDSGPFEYVPGSQAWPLMRGSKVRERLTPEQSSKPNWPVEAETFTTPAIDAEILRRGATIEKFIAKRGDVLIWHGRLMHRGSMARVPGMLRPSLITHYTGIKHRTDMPDRQQDKNGQHYATFPRPSLFKRVVRRLQREIA